MLVLALSLALFAVADEPFGGTPAEAPVDDGVCVLKDDDGVWRSCDDALARKAKTPAAEEAPADQSPAAVALRKRMREAEAAELADAGPPPKTKLEIDYEKAHLDPTIPLLAVRIDVAKKKAVVDAMEKDGRGGPAREEAEAALAEAQSMDDDIERIALHRLDVCLVRHGKKTQVKNYRMTAAGPVMLTTTEMMRQLPMIDPAGCERVNIVDDKVVARVKRQHELKHILATTEFDYYRLDEEKKLREELKQVDTELAADTVAALSAPGVR